MRRALTAGLVYLVMVFSAGFAVGVVRVLAIAPRVGDTWAVLAELPVMLVVSWYAAGWIVGKFHVANTALHRAVMGAASFVLLMVVETAGSVALMQRPLGSVLAVYRETPDLIGLATQIAFAVMPLLRWRVGADATAASARPAPAARP